MTAVELYWALAALVAAWTLIWLERQARTIGSYRMVLEAMDLTGQSDGHDPLFGTVHGEPAARRVLYLIGMLAGLAWPVVLVLWTRSGGGPRG